MAKDFGFSTQTIRQLDLDSADLTTAAAVDRSVEAWNACINCGSCTATCTAGIHFRKLHYRLRAGIDLAGGEAAGILESCLLCGKCQLVCPRGIPLRYLSLVILKTLRTHAENIPSV